MKKQLLLKPLLTLALVMICGSVWAETESYSLTFKTGSTGDGSTITTSTNISSIFSDGASFISSVTSASNVYCGGTTGLKLGKSGGAGSITFSLSTNGSVFASKIVVNAKQYNTSKEVSLSVGGCSGSGELSTDFSDYEFYLSGSKIQALTLSSTNYCWVKSVTVYYEPSNKTLESIEISGNPTTLSYYEGDTFDPAGLIVTGTYDDNSTDELAAGIDWDFNPKTLTEGITSVSVTATVEGTSSSSYLVTGLTVTKVPTYSLVTDAADLKAGDIIVLGCAAKNAVAGPMGSNSYLSSKTAKFSTDGTVLTSAEAIEITLGGEAGAWTLTTSEGQLTTKAEKKLVLNGTTGFTTTCTISIADNNATITFEGWGSILYNAASPRFLNYTSSQTAIQIFKKPQTPKKHEVTIASSGYSTLYLDFAASVPECVTAYYATSYDSENDKVVLTEVDGTIAANQGVILKGTAENTYTFNETAAVSAPATNLLSGTVDSKGISGLSGDNNDYVLKGGVFEPITSGTLPAYKAYLHVDGRTAGSSSIGIRFEGATGIQNVTINEDNTYYDLLGRKVNNPTPGIYILNGKKTLVR